MNSPTQIQFSLLAPQNAVETPSQLIRPDRQGAGEFDHYLDKEINQPHLDRSSRKDRPDTQSQSAKRSDRFDDNLQRARDSRQSDSQKQSSRQTTSPERDTGKVESVQARPESSTQEPKGNSESRLAVADAKSVTPQEHKALGSGQPQATPEQKLVAALQALNVDQKQIQTILDTIQQGPAAKEVMDALAGLLTALVSTEVADATGKATSSGKGDNALKTLASIFNQPTELTETAAKLGAQQKELVSVLEKAGLSPEDAKKLLTAARQGNISTSFNELKTKITHATEDNSLLKEGQAGNQEQKPLSTLLSGRLQAPNATQSQESATTLATQLSANPLLAKAPGVSLQFVSNPGVQATATTAAGVTDSGSGQPVGGATETSARAGEVAKANPPQNVNTRALFEKPVAQQIVEKFNVRGVGQQKEIFIKLDPPSLGTVRMNISTAGETVKTTLVAENQMVKQTIENNLTQLKDALGNQGIKVDSFTVLVGGNSDQAMPHQRHEGQSQARFFGSQHGHGLEQLNLPMEEGLPGYSPRFMHPSQSISLFA